MSDKTKSYICLVLVAFLFGFSYVFQSNASNYTGPLTFSFYRYLLATICLLPFLFKKDHNPTIEYIKSGFVLALTFLVASGSQQFAAGKTSSGKVGFITSMYIVLVPVVEFILFKKKLNKKIIISVLMAVVGLGLLCGITTLEFNGYDFLVIFAALAYAFEIIYIEKISNRFNEFKLMFFAFGISTILFLIVSLLFEGLYVADYKAVILPIAYLGIGAGAIGYCLQCKGQKNTESTIASIIMSLESVVSIISGTIFLKETLSLVQLVGCVLMFIATIICIKAQKN